MLCCQRCWYTGRHDTRIGLLKKHRSASQQWESYASTCSQIKPKTGTVYPNQQRKPKTGTVYPNHWEKTKRCNETRSFGSQSILWWKIRLIWFRCRHLVQGYGCDGKDSWSIIWCSTGSKWRWCRASDYAWKRRQLKYHLMQHWK